MRHPGQVVALSALQHKLGLEPGAGAVLLALYRFRFFASRHKIAEAAGCAEGCVKVYIGLIRRQIGADAVETDKLFGYRMTPEAREEVRSILADMFAEVNAFLAPLMEAA